MTTNNDRAQLRIYSEILRDIANYSPEKLGGTAFTSLNARLYDIFGKETLVLALGLGVETSLMEYLHSQTIAKRIDFAKNGKPRITEEGFKHIKSLIDRIY